MSCYCTVLSLSLNIFKVAKCQLCVSTECEGFSNEFGMFLTDGK